MLRYQLFHSMGCSDEMIAVVVVYSTLDLGSLILFPVGQKLCLSQHPRWFRIPALNKGDSPIELPSLYG